MKMRKKMSKMTPTEQLEEIYESVVGINGRERFTHKELIAWLLEIYDDSQALQKIKDKE